VFSATVAKYVVTPSETKYILSVVLVYGGLLLLMRVWLRLPRYEVAPRRKTEVALVDAVALGDAHDHRAATLQPDVFSYAARGDDLRQHSPYLYGPSPWDRLPMSPRSILSGEYTAPYGPFFLFLDGKIDWISQHHELWTVVGLRLLETFAVAMIGYGVVMLAGAWTRPRRGVRALGDDRWSCSR